MTQSETNGTETNGTETNGTKSDKPVVCVFCASSPGSNPAHMESARTLGKALTDAGYTLVYGGGTQGIMGELSKTVVQNSSPENVEGVIPRALIQTEKDSSKRNDEGKESEERKTFERTVTKEQLKRMKSEDVIPMSEFGRTTIVSDMHTRKGLMAQRVRQGGPGSGFVALAGGYGTMEEVMEMVTWNQLGIHKLPIVLVNVNGYWDGLLEWVKNSIQEGFVAKGNKRILMEVKDPKDVPDALKRYEVAEDRLGLDWSNPGHSDKKET